MAAAQRRSTVHHYSYSSGPGGLRPGFISTGTPAAGSPVSILPRNCCESCWDLAGSLSSRVWRETNLA
jgi:hypothetical protein